GKDDQRHDIGDEVIHRTYPFVRIRGAGRTGWAGPSSDCPSEGTFLEASANQPAGPGRRRDGPHPTRPHSRGLSGRAAAGPGGGRSTTLRQAPGVCGGVLWGAETPSVSPRVWPAPLSLGPAAAVSFTEQRLTGSPSSLNPSEFDARRVKRRLSCRLGRRFRSAFTSRLRPAAPSTAQR